MALDEAMGDLFGQQNGASENGASNREGQYENRCGKI
jgi:hypothetical protein